MKLNQRMQEHMSGARFEDLPKPFVCVAAEIRTGHEIWLSSGSLITAMRASYALPGVFEPVTCNGRVLVDGALVNPVPVSVLPGARAAARGRRQPPLRPVRPRRCDQAQRRRARGREAELGKRHDAHAVRDTRLGITGVMVEAFNIIQDRISRARLAGDPPDLSLQPKLGHIGLSEFHRADEAIAIGYEATKAQIGELHRMQTVLT